MPTQLFELLSHLSIPYELHHHRPVFTCEEALAIEKDLKGAKVKNLVLTNKKGYFTLLTVLENKRVNIKELQLKLNKGSLSFAKENDLKELLNITPGSVTPCALMYDKEKKVDFFMDQDLIHFEYINVHPLRNDMTMTLTVKDLFKFIEFTTHPIHTIAI